MWVVDNDSSDDGAEFVAQSYPRAKLMRSRYNRGFAGGCNWGAEQTNSDIIFFLNPDTQILPDCLSQLAVAFALHPNLGIAGCKLLEPGGRIIQHVGAEIRPNGLTYHIGEGEKDKGQYTGLRPCAYVQGAALAVRRSVWNELHGFDEGFFPAYFEEADLCRRARDAGYEVAVYCEAEVIHHQDPSKQVQSRRFLEMLFRGRARYLLKHYSPKDWVTKFWPAELKWLLSPNSKGYRRIALRTLWETASGKRGKDEG